MVPTDMLFGDSLDLILVHENEGRVEVLTAQGRHKRYIAISVNPLHTLGVAVHGFTLAINTERGAELYSMETGKKQRSKLKSAYTFPSSIPVYVHTSGPLAYTSDGSLALATLDYSDVEEYNSGVCLFGPNGEFVRFFDVPEAMIFSLSFESVGGNLWAFDGLTWTIRVYSLQGQLLRRVLSSPTAVLENSNCALGGGALVVLNDSSVYFSPLDEVSERDVARFEGPHCNPFNFNYSSAPLVCLRESEHTSPSAFLAFPAVACRGGGANKSSNSRCPRSRLVAHNIGECACTRLCMCEGIDHIRTRACVSSCV